MILRKLQDILKQSPECPSLPEVTIVESPPAAPNTQKRFRALFGDNGADADVSAPVAGAGVRRDKRIHSDAPEKSPNCNSTELHRPTPEMSSMASLPPSPEMPSALMRTSTVIQRSVSFSLPDPQQSQESDFLPSPPLPSSPPAPKIRKKKRRDIMEDSPFNPERMRRAAIAAENSVRINSEDEIFCNSTEYSTEELPAGRLGVVIRKNQTTFSGGATASLDTVSLDSQGIPRNWEKLVAGKGKGCHLCQTAMLRTDRKKKCHCKKMVHRDCFAMDGDSCK